MQIDLDKLSFGNGAGSIKTLEQVEKACRGPQNRIMVGSITFFERTGNLGDVYYFHPQEMWSLNSLGLPNRGIEAYKSLLKEMVKRAHDAGKELWASISPFSAEECGQMIVICLECGVDGVEINGSCPNVWKDGVPKAIPALDPPAAYRMFELAAVYAGHDGLQKVSFKLSPTRDKALLVRLATVIKDRGIKRIVCCNAIPLCSGLRVDGKPALAFREAEGADVKHVGGHGGTAAFDINKWVATTMRTLLPIVDIDASGGVFAGPDAKLYLAEAKVTGIQSTTGYLEFGNQLFVDMLMYLSDQLPA